MITGDRICSINWSSIAPSSNIKDFDSASSAAGVGSGRGGAFKCCFGGSAGVEDFTGATNGGTVGLAIKVGFCELGIELWADD